MKSHIGIYSGTFDPVHVGHIAFAEKALKICSLNKVIFLPEPEPREKSNVTNITRRIELIKQAIAGTQNLAVLEPESPQFTTTKTLPYLHGLFKDADLTLLVGSDVVRTFPYRWENLDVLLRDVSLAIGMRLGDTSDEIITIIEALQKKYAIRIHYALVKTSKSHIASMHIRKASR